MSTKLGEDQTASASEVATSRPWLKQELELLKPDILVCLGRTPALSVLGKMIKISDYKGEFFETSLAKKTIILPHPASILRASTEELEMAMGEFLNYLRKIL